MRLLNVHDFELHSFAPANVPKYAIASHRWIEGSEAMIKDISKKRNTQTQGYLKVQGFTRYIRDSLNGIDWLWIDTCCINQDSSLEVGEAVNSMLRYYHNAQLCLVYLHDVAEAQQVHELCQSSWFTRGWTLQELIAPSAMIFLTRDWQVIGHKGSRARDFLRSALSIGRPLESALTEITGIPEAIFRNSWQEGAVKSEQVFKWMTDRDTTREEDLSYCLFGLLNVSLPVIYGEGKTKAKDRLVAALDINSDAETLALSRLPVAFSAAFNSKENESFPECLPNTRVELLGQIGMWANSMETESMFWLCGMAGAGKSTIARTVARKFYESNQLAASFFFSRSEAERASADKVLPSICYQLCRRFSIFAREVRSTLERDPDLITRSRREQFQKLIFDPLQNLLPALQLDRPLIIIFDALDECEDGSYVSLLLELLFKLRELEPAMVRVLVTSRPEDPIYRQFNSVPQGSFNDIQLHQTEEWIIKHDIDVFFQHELAKVRLYRSMPATWPGAEATNTLVSMAQPLFIFAATICRQLYDTNWNPQEALDDILVHRLDSSELDRTYLPIFDRLCAGQSQRKLKMLVERFRKIVGSIILLYDPLTVPTLSKIVNVSDVDIHTCLTPLHSVLDSPRNTPNHTERMRPVRLFHSSFRDYLVDPGNRTKHPFWVDERAIHTELAHRCITLLLNSDFLKRDVLNLRDPGTLRHDIDIHTIRASIPPEIRYACLHWTSHIKESKQHVDKVELACMFLETKFIFWIEVLALLGSTYESIAMIQTLQAQIKTPNDCRTSLFLDDAYQFLLYFAKIVDEAPLQLYASGLIFSPLQSLIRKRFDNERYNMLCNIPVVQPTWSTNCLVLPGQGIPISSMHFSQDSMRLTAVDYNGQVRSWNTATGQEVSTGVFDNCGLSHSQHDESEVSPSIGAMYYNYVILAPTEARYVVHSNEELSMWDLTKGQITWTKAHFCLSRANLVKFSPEGMFIAAAQANHTISILDAQSGDQVWQVKGDDQTDAAPFALGTDTTNDKLLAIASVNGAVKIWSIYKRRQVRSLLNDQAVSKLEFSPTYPNLATVSIDNKLKIWDIANGAEVWSVEAFAVRKFFCEMAYSPTGDRLAISGFNWCTIFDAFTGETLQELEVTDDVLSMVFSPNGQVLALSDSADQVHIWNTATGRTRSAESYDDEVLHISSLDSKRLVLVSNKSLRVLDMSTGNLLQEHDLAFEDARSIRIFQNCKSFAMRSCGMLEFRDFATGEVVLVLSTGHGKQFTTAFSPTKQVVACAFPKDNSEYAIKVLDMITDQVLLDTSVSSAKNDLDEPYQFNGPYTCQITLSISPDVTKLAVGKLNCWLIIHNFLTDQKVYVPQGRSTNLFNMAFSTGGELLAMPSMGNGPLVIWNIQSQRTSLQIDVGYVDSLVFSLDTRWLAGKSSAEELSIWAVSTGEKVWSLQDFYCSSFEFSADARFLHTNFGQLHIGLDSLSKEVPGRPAVYHWVRSEGWFYRNGKKLLWIPHHRGTGLVAYSEGSFASDWDSRSVTMMRFNDDFHLDIGS